jgi:hypothetical protein
MGHDDPRVRGHWLHGPSSEVEASIDGGVIARSSGLNREPPSGGFLFGNS